MNYFLIGVMSLLLGIATATNSYLSNPSTNIVLMAPLL
jgi:hypothetical protein